MKCGDKFTVEMHEKINEGFWKLGDTDLQRLFLTKCVTSEKKNRTRIRKQTKTGKRRNRTNIRKNKMAGILVWCPSSRMLNVLTKI